MPNRILFVDDNSEITRLISKYLRLKNYDVTVANDGKKALSLIQSQKFDVILLDISMSGLSGFDIIEYLKKEGMIKDQSIVVLTAIELSQDEIDEMLENGVHNCLLKPVDMSLLTSTIQSNLITI